MTNSLLQKLDELRIEKKVLSKGKLATVLFLTRLVIEEGLPFDPEKLRTAGQGQVAGLGREPVQKILAEYGIYRILAEEGGRTSRGSVGLAEDYVNLLNSLNNSKAIVTSDLKVVEGWWIDQVMQLFNRQCLKINFDPTLTISALVARLLESARVRQSEMDGLRVEGAVLHYLVGAKLRMIFPKIKLQVRGFSVADEATSEKGDFIVGDTIVHATTAPSERLLTKCQKNIESGCRPLIVCPKNKVAAALGLAEIAKIKDRVEVFDAEMFVSANVNERGVFGSTGIQQSARDLIHGFNEIIDEVESDPSLKIEEM